FAIERRRSARAGGRRRSRGAAGQGPRAATAPTAGSISAAGTTRARVRRDRRGPGNDPRGGAGALSPRGQEIKGVPEMKDDATFHEAKLQELAQRLGTRAAERLDVERTAQAVVARLHEEARAPARPSVWSQPAWLKIAAALVIVVGAGAVARGVRQAPSGATGPVETVDLSDMS